MIWLNLFGGNNDNSGNSFYFRDFRNAYHLRPDINPPRQQFQGYVNFVINRTLFNTLYGEDNGQGGDPSSFRRQISSLVRTAGLPGVKFETSVKKSYNRYKINQTGVSFDDVSIQVFDTVGNEWITLLMKYYAYHYMNPRNKQEQIPSADRDLAERIISGRDFNSNDYGFNPNLVSNFFERIDIILYHGGKGIQYSLQNPVLTGFSSDDLDYSSSNVRSFNLEFQYENFIMNNVINFDLSEFDVSRFEDARRFQGGVFDAGRKPLALEEGNETELQLLGNQSDQFRGRSYQYPLQEGDSSDVLRFSTDDSGNFVVPGPSGSVDRPDIFGRPAEGVAFAEPENTSDSWFSDALGNVIDAGLSAAINGADITDAVLGAVASEVVEGAAVLTAPLFEEGDTGGDTEPENPPEIPGNP